MSSNGSNLSLKVSEMFYSLQGEGARAGTPTIFIRLQGCSAKHACFASGVRCDTEFESGSMHTVDALLEKIKKFPSKEITWTGGEPCDQLTDAHIAHFKEAGYYQAIETSGIKRPPVGLDFICVSPKVAEHVLAKNFEGVAINELRYVRHEGQGIPNPALTAIDLWLSPHFAGNMPTPSAIQHCVELCLANPAWRLSLQIHKLISIL